MKATALRIRIPDLRLRKTSCWKHFLSVFEWVKAPLHPPHPPKLYMPTPWSHWREEGESSPKRTFLQANPLAVFSYEGTVKLRQLKLKSSNFVHQYDNHFYNTIWGTSSWIHLYWSVLSVDYSLHFTIWNWQWADILFYFSSCDKMLKVDAEKLL